MLDTSLAKLDSNSSLTGPEPIEQSQVHELETDSVDVKTTQGDTFDVPSVTDIEPVKIDFPVVKSGEIPIVPQNQPVLNNFVATVNLRCSIDLKKLALNAKNVVYDPRKFPAATMKIRNPKATAQIFSNGKFVCLGTKSEEETKLASKKIAKIIKNLGYEVRFTDFKIVNTFASCDLGFQVKLR